MENLTKSKRLLATSEEIAEVTGECKHTILKKTRAGYFRGMVTGGGKGNPYRYNVPKVEKKYGFEPGTIADRLS